MARILLDQNVPFALTRHLPGHAVTHASTAGWSTLANGLLIAAAEADGYDILITADQNLAYQQNLTDRRLSLIVLGTNNWASIRSALSSLSAAVERIGVAGYRFVPFDRPALRRRPFPPALEC